LRGVPSAFVTGLGRSGPPPVTRFATWIASHECTIDISRAERELGYRS
jgi:hypothetical protein